MTTQMDNATGTDDGPDEARTIAAIKTLTEPGPGPVAAPSLLEESEFTDGSLSSMEEPPTGQPDPAPKLSEAADQMNRSLEAFSAVLGTYDICRGAIEGIAKQARDLRVSLDNLQQDELIESTVAGVRIPMTAGMVLEAKRTELRRAMNYMQEICLQTADRAEELIMATYLDARAERGNAPSFTPHVDGNVEDSTFKAVSGALDLDRVADEFGDEGAQVTATEPAPQLEGEDGGKLRGFANRLKGMAPAPKTGV